MGVNPSDVPPWVQEYGPKVVSGLEKTAEQVAKLAGVLRSLLAATGKPSATSVTIHPPWLVNPEADANDRSHADSDPMEEAYRLAWEMNKQQRITGFDEFAIIAKELLNSSGSRLDDITFITKVPWEGLQSFVQTAWRRHVDRVIFHKTPISNEAPSAR